MMEKVVVFGIGRNWEKWKEKIEDDYEVVALIDNNPEKCKVDNVLPVEYLTDNSCPRFDKIIITTKQFGEMYDQLIGLKIDPRKIIIHSLDREMYRHSILGLNYFGQHTDDLVLAAIFSMIGIDKPSYIDLGANHPLDISNTAFLYEQGCRGINVEANPDFARIIKQARPEDTTLNVGVSAQDGGVLPFYKFYKYSGLNTFSKSEAEKWGFPIDEIIELPVISLKHIVDEYSPKGFPDFLDCDIEGLDYEVLNGYDLKSNGPKVICVEVRPEEIKKFDSMLDVNGYYRFCRLGENNIYVQKEFSQALSHCCLE